MLELGELEPVSELEDLEPVSEPPELPELLEPPEPPEPPLVSLVPASFAVEPPSAALPDRSAASLEPLSPSDRDRVRLAVERSFLAHPEPLKCTVGATNALRSVPSAPHAGQNLGPGALMLWITSVVCPQFPQT